MDFFLINITLGGENWHYGEYRYTNPTHVARNRELRGMAKPVSNGGTAGESRVCQPTALASKWSKCLLTAIMTWAATLTGFGGVTFGPFEMFVGLFF